jgi:hypothetical protein
VDVDFFLGVDTEFENYLFQINYHGRNDLRYECLVRLRLAYVWYRSRGMVDLAKVVDKTGRANILIEIFGFTLPCRIAIRSVVHYS